MTTNRTEVKTVPDSIATAVKRVKRLNATFELYERNSDLDTIGTSDSRFNELVTSECAAAERGIQAAMDDVEGNNLTSLDTALHLVRLCRRDFFLPVASSAGNARHHAKSAFETVFAVYSSFALA
jgi:hypothetical protein